MWDRRQFVIAGPALLAAAAEWAQAAVAESLPFASALEAGRAIATGKVSSVELTTHMLSRIERLNPKVNAVVTVAREQALEAARAADAALRRGRPRTPLHGVPIDIKDTFATAGLRTTAGHVALAEHRPLEDATAVARLKKAGAVILGKTNVPDMAADWQSYNAIFGASSNPWDLKRTPGGSTGGGAAALAAGLSFLSLGSDIGGSIRIPAHFCGVYGHKPTINVVPRRGHIPPPPNTPPGPAAVDLACAGPLARHPGDLAAALRILGGPDGDEARAYRWQMPAPRRTRLRDYRVGFVLDHQQCPVPLEVRDVLENAVGALRKAEVTLREGWPTNVNPRDEFDNYRLLLYTMFPPQPLEDPAEADRRVLELRATYPDRNEALQAQAALASRRRFYRAVLAQHAARRVWQDFFREFDVFLMPVAFLPAFPHDHSRGARKLATLDGPRDYLDLLFWISFATHTGLPATSAPVGFTRDGLPVGLQILGPFLEDATPIDFALKMSEVVGGYRAPAGFA
jgi:amidase